MRSVRIGIDASCWSNRRGFGRFTRCLLTELIPLAASRGHHTTVVADRGTLGGADLPAGVSQVAVEMSAPASEAAAAGGSRSLRDMAAMAVASTRMRSDVFFFPATYSYVPVLGTRLVVTAHDAIAETLPDLIVPSRLDRWRWAAKQRLALRQAAIVLTVSEAARRDVVDVLGVAAERVRVVGEAADPRFRPPPAGAPPPRPSVLQPIGARPYLLYVGGFSPHKNLVTLIRSFGRLLERVPDAALVLAGDIDGDPFLSAATEVRAALAALPNPAQAIVTGFVSDDDLVRLYQGAEATLLVSLGEGFGLPVAESMACGIPVIVSDLPALRELAGDAGTVVDPHDERAIAAAMATVLEDVERRAKMSAIAVERAASRSWEVAAVTVLDLLEEVAGR